MVNAELNFTTSQMQSMDFLNEFGPMLLLKYADFYESQYYFHIEQYQNVFK